MKSIHLHRRLGRLAVLFIVCAAIHASAQLIPNGGFELGTRAPLVTNLSVDFVYPEEAMPSWDFAGAPLSYNWPILSGPGVTIVGAPRSTIEGDYSLGLKVGYIAVTNAVSVWQTVLFPADSLSVTYDVQVVNQVGILFPLTPMIDGQTIQPVLLSSGATADTYGIDV